MTTLTRMNPFRTAAARFEPAAFDDLFRKFAMRTGFGDAEPAPEMKLDVSEEDKAFIVRAEIPGVKKDDIKVDVDGNLVSVRAEVRQEKEEKQDEKIVYSERSYGMASRSFTLPGEVDAGGAKAEYKDGLLSLTLPKKANGGGKRVPVS